MTAAPASAGLVLTSAGQAAGFSLANFADGFPSNGGGVGPVGITFTSSGGVMVSSYADGRVAVFPTDTNGQHYSGATLASSTYNFNNAAGLARTSDGNIYMALQGGASLLRLDQAGNALSTTATGLPAATGVATNPNNNHLFVSTLGNHVIWDVNPTSGAKSVFVNASADGLTANSTTLYGEVDGHIVGFRISDGAQVFDSGFINGADGAVLGTGGLTGFLFVNTNDGRLVEVNLSTNAQVVIANGGSRGDLVTVDPSNGSLLLTQSNSVVRLTAPAGSAFGDPVGNPEPATIAVFGVLAAGAFALRRRVKPAA